MEIFWSAMSIIILCTWNILHLNVPAIRNPHAGSWHKMWWKISGSKKKVKWMIITILVPELLLGKAASGRSTFKNPFLTLSVRDRLANMGYFVLDWGDPSTDSKHDEDLKTRRIELKQAIEESLNRKDFSESYRINISRLESRFWALSADQWDLLEYRDIARVPDIPDWQLERLDSSSGLVKILAVIQVTWLIIQLSARKRLGYPSSQLEFSALAYAACSIVTFGFYWNHPQDVEAVLFVKAEAWKKDNLPSSDAATLIRDLGQRGPRYLCPKWRIRSKVDRDVGPEPIPNDSTHGGVMGLHEVLSMVQELGNSFIPVFGYVQLLLGVAFGGLFFGGVHCLAWTSKFPTPGEAFCWKICSTAITYIPYLASLLLFIFEGSREWTSGKAWLEPVRKRVLVTLMAFLFLLYILARLFLIVESIRSLFFLPPKAFENTWAGLFPHAG